MLLVLGLVGSVLALILVHHLLAWWHVCCWRELCKGVCTISWCTQDDNYAKELASVKALLAGRAVDGCRAGDDERCDPFHLGLCVASRQAVCRMRRA